MKFTYTQTDPNPREIFVTHNGESLDFNIAKLSKKDANMELIIGDINHYFLKLRPETHDAIWDLYVEARDIIRETVDSNRMHVRLKNLVTKLYSHLPYESFSEFVEKSARIRFPRDLRTQYGEGAPNSPLTYLRHEYQQLLTLVVYLRPMLPIWGEYISAINEESGAQYKEYQAGRLMRETALVHCAPYVRLQDYITAFVAGDNAPIEAILGALGSEQIPDWLLAIALIRRLTFCELVTENHSMEPTNVVSNIYNYIRSRLEGLPKAFGGNVRDKKPMGRADKGNGEDNTSIPELYKMKEPITEGSILVLAEYLSNPIRVAKHVDAKIPNALVQTCVRHLRHNPVMSYHPDQITLIQFCLSKVISSRGIPHLEHDSLKAAAAVTQALLWHRGLYDLAALMSCEGTILDGNSFIGTQKLKLDVAETEALLIKYRHVQPQRNPKKDTLLNRQKTNVAFRAIESITETLDEVTWKLSVPEDLQKHVSMVQLEEGYKIPPTIKSQLCSMILTFC